ncbi:hypothetical protein FRB98_005263 [Tulasnella sp. 332]|nr:hypothetical protein FRB98_005263 [Tulasnella sp. 332]
MSFLDSANFSPEMAARLKASLDAVAHPKPPPTALPTVFQPPPVPAFVPPAFQPLPVPMPIAMPPAFDSAPERVQIITGVKAAIENINEVIDLLNHPIANEGDIIDMDYAPDTVTTFKIRSAECEQNLASASMTASAWFTSVGKILQDVTNTLSNVKDEMNTTDQEIAKNTALMAANVKAIADLTQDKEHESQLLAKAQADYKDAQDRLDSAHAERTRVHIAQGFFTWFPPVSVALSIVDQTKEQGDIDSAEAVAKAEGTQLTNDQMLLEKTAWELKNQQQDGIALHATMTGLQANDQELKTQQEKLNEDSTFLGPLKVNIDHAIHTVTSAFGSGSNVDNMMSMKNVGTSIRGLVDALKNDDDFKGALATMDEPGWAELDKRVQAMQKASKRPALNV